MTVPLLCPPSHSSSNSRCRLELIIHNVSFDELKPILISMEPHVKLTNAQSPSTGTEYTAMQHIPYSEAINSLMYAVLSMHLDISYAVSIVFVIYRTSDQANSDPTPML